MTLDDYLQQQTAAVDAALQRWVPPALDEPRNLHSAMRYSLFAGGKRIRPILCISAACAVRKEAPGVVDAASTLELIHTYSLIHDDLPALDNDDLRRGLPTCHRVYGDAMAILAGDALLTLAFEVLAKIDVIAPETRVRLAAELATAAGTVRGMIAGQVHDIEGENQPPTRELLDKIHRAKTGALLRASLRMGALCAGASPEEFKALSQYGAHVGLAFQIVDDILDVEMPSEALGKTAGKDVAQGKITFPAVYGMAESYRMAEQERAAAHAALELFGDRAFRLREIADRIVHRKA